VALALGAKDRLATTGWQVPEACLRQTRTGILPLISSLSVFLRGMVHASATWSPVRTAERLLRGSGSLSEGGNGAPGVPQPVKPIAAAKPAASAMSTQ